MQQLVRIIHQRHFDRNLGRFQSLAFKPSSNGGISVFCARCAVETTGSACQHIQRFYPEVSGEPPIFWTFNTSILPDEHIIEETLSDTNDSCHRDIKNITPRKAERIFKAHAKFPDSFQICQACNSDRPLTLGDLIRQD